jgi:hypothetical protein
MELSLGTITFEEFSKSLLDDIDYTLAVRKDECHQFALHRLRDRFRKKFAVRDPQLATDAINKFKIINHLVSTKRVVTDPFILHNARLFINQAFERYNKRFDSDLIQVPFDISHIISEWRFGPGASNDVKGTHTAEKLYQPMSCTVAAEPLVKSLRETNVYIRSFDAMGNTPTRVVGGSRLATVPKNEENDRTIAIEPSGNMSLQLAVGVYIEKVLRSIGLDIKLQQDLNKSLAKLGSISGGLVTIDMKSASDLILVDLCRKLLPHQLSLFMLRIRSPECELPDGEVLKLNMMSTMGNGFTFPLMTLLFVSLLYAVRLRRGGPVNYIDWSTCGIFGDDIVCTKDEASELISVIEDSGFIINKDKSFLEGDFRESCGGDYYKGYDCTPFYVKSLSGDSEVYVAINQIFDYCGKHGFIFDKVICCLVRHFKHPLHLVPEWHSDTDGVRTTQVPRRYTHLAVKQKRIVLRNEHFASMLIAGGYIASGGPGLSYIPRPLKTRYVVRKSRLPNGFLDGRDVFSRSNQVSDFVSSWTFLVKRDI